MEKALTVRIHLYTQSEPVEIEDVRNAYQKGDLYCVLVRGAVEKVYKFPIQHIFRITEFPEYKDSPQGKT